MTYQHIAEWLAAPATVALAHRYFLSFAGSLPDLAPAAGYWKRTVFNLIQGIAGNEHRVIVTRCPAGAIPNDQLKGTQ